MTTAIAHTKNKLGQRQDLLDHLTRVADLARGFAEPLGAGDLAYYAGLLHDIGKYNPVFQRYLLEAEAGTTRQRHGPDHKGAGATLAQTLGLPLLSFLIAGHHGGIPARADLKIWLRERGADPEVTAAIRSARDANLGLLAALRHLQPGHIQMPHDAELFIRLLFSALVDADFLDTESHFNAGQPTDRSGGPTLAELCTHFETYQRAHTGQRDDVVNTLRHQVFEQCLAAADLTPGFFRLTAPTGIGKTRSSLGFALRHALKHGQRRIIYAIPYTSITEQTADEFRDIFAEFPRAVLEHHSGLSPKDPDNPVPSELWGRLAAENWDAPLVVTTTVQLFESLMACSPSACRKLHHVAGSTIILDEAQMLPTHLLAPLLDVLRHLVAHCGVTVVLCTATQPALDESADFHGLPTIREIVPNAERLFTMLKR
ncbi:MAG: CRISPR-associated endonuclease Cas3'', partial [Ktedonobacterales bacterium]|nr:CRISPR-associated endonuclease Cas3'' [Ktedonobacterales bacterium]